MDVITWQQLLITLPFIFVGGFVDAIAGGGGVINWIGFLISGVPIHAAYGSGVVSGIFGTATSSINYVKEKHYAKDYLPFGSLGTVIGSSIGSYLVTQTAEETLKIIMICILPIIAIVMVFHGKYANKIEVNLSKRQIYYLSFIVGLVLGFYGGFIGPGIGTFLIIAFSFMGLELLKAGGTAKIINFVMCLVAGSVFLASGIVNWYLAIPCLIVNVIANQIGSHVAISNGEKIIKPVMLVVVILLFVKVIFDVIAS